ncbi:MAG: hypothetical protein ACI4LA_08725 [Emergencia sp.]
MKMEPVTRRMSLNEFRWEEAERYFRAYTGVCPADVPEKFADYVIPMRDVIREQGEVILKYGCSDVTGRETDAVILEEGQALTGRMIGKAYRDAEKVILFTASVINIDELLSAHRDMMESFFLEYWAVSVLSVCREWLIGELEQRLSGTGLKQTSVWSPGQSRFELCNQKPLFALLKPESAGISLDRNMRMLPLKSISGTIGLVPENSEISMISCDYCEHARICPGYKGVRYQDSREERRLI